MHSNRQLLTSILARLESLEQHIQEISQGMLQNNEVLRNKFNEVDKKQQSVQSVQSVQSSATLNNNEVIKQKIGHIEKALLIHHSELDKHATTLDIVYSVSSSVSV